MGDWCLPWWHGIRGLPEEESRRDGAKRHGRSICKSKGKIVRHDVSGSSGSGSRSFRFVRIPRTAHACNVYKGLKFPPEIYEQIGGYYEKKLKRLPDLRQTAWPSLDNLPGLLTQAGLLDLCGEVRNSTEYRTCPRLDAPRPRFCLRSDGDS
jgi:hypothetical protein